MRAGIAIILKTVLGGIVGALIFLSLGSVKGIFDGLRQIEISGVLRSNPLDILLIPSFIFLGFWLGALNVLLLGGDLILISSFIGFGTAFLVSLRKVILSRFPEHMTRNAFRAAFLALAMVTILCIGVKIQTIGQIKTTFANFCASVNKKDFPSAFKYILPEYRSQTNFDKFTMDMESPSIYLTICNEKKFVSSFLGDKAYISLSTSFADFPIGIDLIMKRFNGEWYLTGERDWYE